MAPQTTNMQNNDVHMCVCMTTRKGYDENDTSHTYTNHGRRGAERFLRRPVEGWKYAHSHFIVDSLLHLFY